MRESRIPENYHANSCLPIECGMQCLHAGGHGKEESTIELSSNVLENFDQFFQHTWCVYVWYSAGNWVLLIFPRLTIHPQFHFQSFLDEEICWLSLGNKINGNSCTSVKSAFSLNISRLNQPIRFRNWCQILYFISYHENSLIDCFLYRAWFYGIFKPMLSANDFCRFPGQRRN